MLPLRQVAIGGRRARQGSRLAPTVSREEAHGSKGRCSGGILDKADAHGLAIKVDLRGSADNDSKTALGQFIERLHSEAEHLHMSEIIVNVHELYFINSVCLKSLVQWVDRIVNMPSHRRYTLTFLVDPRLHWQDRSLLALQHMAPEFVRITNWRVG